MEAEYRAILSPSPSSAPDHLKSGPRVWGRARAREPGSCASQLTLRGPRGARLVRLARASSPAGPGHPSPGYPIRLPSRGWGGHLRMRRSLGRCDQRKDYQCKEACRGHAGSLISNGSARGSSAGRLPCPARRASACRRAGRAPSLGRRLSARLTPALSIPRLGFQRAGVELRRLVPDPARAERARPERRAPSALTL